MAKISRVGNAHPDFLQGGTGRLPTLLPRAGAPELEVIIKVRDQGQKDTLEIEIWLKCCRCIADS